MQQAQLLIYGVYATGVVPAQELYPFFPVLELDTNLQVVVYIPSILLLYAIIGYSKIAFVKNSNSDTYQPPPPPPPPPPPAPPPENPLPELEDGELKTVLL